MVKHTRAKNSNTGMTFEKSATEAISVWNHKHNVYQIQTQKAQFFKLKKKVPSQ